MTKCASLVIFILIAFSAVPQASAAERNYEIRWGALPAGSVWQVISNAILEDVKRMNPNITGSIVPSATAANVIGVFQGKFNVAVSNSDTTAAAWDGEGYFKPYGKIRNIRNLMTMSPLGTHIIVGADSNINKLEDLKGKRISPAARGLSNDLETQRLLALYGLSYKDFKVSFMSLEDAALQFIDGHLDALMFLTVPYPFPPVINANSNRKIKLLPIPDDKIAELCKFRGVMPHTLPAGTYSGINYPVKGIMVRTHVIVRDDFPDDIAYAIVKSVVSNWKRYPTVAKVMAFVKENDIAMDVGIPFHPGAIKFMKEKGLPVNGQK